MEWYDIVFLVGSTITLIGAALSVSVVHLEGNSLGLLILLLGMIAATYGLVLRVFNKIFKKKDKILVLT